MALLPHGRAHGASGACRACHFDDLRSFDPAHAAKATNQTARILTGAL